MSQLLTQSQTDVLEKIIALQKVLSRKPTIGELADALGRSRSSISTSLESLKKKGLLVERQKMLEVRDAVRNKGERPRKKMFDIDRAITIANVIAKNCDDKSKVKELYISYIIKTIFRQTIPAEIGLSELPPNIEADLAKISENIEVLDSGSLWQFLSDQVEFISSFKNGSSNIIEVSKTIRRRGGTYLTSPELGINLAKRLMEHFLENNPKISAQSKLISPINVADIKVLDPACGTGGLLNAVVKEIESNTTLSVEPGDALSVRRKIVRDCVFGVDKDIIAVKVARFLFWASTYNGVDGIVPDIREGDSLIGSTFRRPLSTLPGYAPCTPDRPFDWNKEYCSLKGFSIIITNPPWEKVKAVTREAMEHAGWTAPSRAEIEKKLTHTKNQGVQEEIERYRRLVKDRTEYLRRCGQYPLSSRGEMNYYALFVERCRDLLAEGGVMGLIVPTGIATDFHLKELFSDMMDKKEIIEFHDFLNKRKIFQNVDGRYRFSYLITIKGVNKNPLKVSFYNFVPRDIDGSTFTLTEEEIQSLNPMTKTLIVPKDPKVIPLLLRVHKKFGILSDGREDKGSWNVKFRRQADMTNDSKHFVSTESMVFDEEAPGLLCSGGRDYLRVYEGKMADMYNHRAGSSVSKTGKYSRSGLSLRPSMAELGDPNFLVRSRYAVPLDVVQDSIRLQGNLKPWHLAFKDITAATNRRTVRAAILPKSVVSNKLPTLEVADPKVEACLLCILNSVMFDFLARQKIGNITLNWFILRQIPVPSLVDVKKGTVDGKRISTWLIERCSALTYTSNDLREWGEKVARQNRPTIWNESERQEIESEIDALVFHLYGLSEDEVKLVLREFPNSPSEKILKRMTW